MLGAPAPVNGFLCLLEPAATGEPLDHGAVEGAEDGHEVEGGLATHRPDGEREVEAAHATDAEAGA
jgi:hypothetical protein